MPRFFCEDVPDDRIILTGEDAIHLSRSLRVRIGEEITVCDGRCTDYLCTVENVSSEAVTLAVKKKAPCEAEPNQTITLYQALPKGDKLDFIVQKAVELGLRALYRYRRGFAWQKVMRTALKKSGCVCKRLHWRRPSSADAALFQRSEICCLLRKRQTSSADGTVLFATKRAGKQSVR